MEDAGELLTVPEVARELGVSQSAIRNALYEERLPSVTKYGRRLIARTDLEAYRRRTQPEGEKRTGRPPRQGTSDGQEGSLTGPAE